MGDDPMHVMMRQIMALFDEYQSKENAKHVLRALKENARQGFWNGSLPPIGYCVVATEQRGAKVKKKLEIDLLHADTIRLIYRLALEGDGTSGPMGVKNIAAYLNRHRIFTRDGGRWGIGQVHRILTRKTYIGEHKFNKRSKAKELKPVSEIVTVKPERLEEVLAAVLDRRQERTERRREHIAELNKRAAETDLRLKPLYDAIETGVADLDDPALKERITGLKAIRDQAQADAERAQAMAESTEQQAITPAMVQKFARTARERIRIEDGGYRRDHLRALAQTGRGGRRRGPHHGNEGRLAQNPRCRLGCEIGGERRSQFCSELAEGMGFEPTIRVYPV
jgi:hypothetical protein